MERALLLTAAGEERASWRGVPVKAAAEATKAKRRAKTVFMVLVVDSTDLPHEALEDVAAIKPGLLLLLGAR